MSEVLLNIKGSQVQGEEYNDVELTTEGILTRQNGRSTISYDDSEMAGENVQTIIHVDGNIVTMQKTGAIQTQFVFEVGKTYITAYSTPFGELDVSLIPTLVDTKIEDACGKIELEYVMNIAGSQIVYRLNLSYTAGDPKNHFGIMS